MKVIKLISEQPYGSFNDNIQNIITENEYKQ